MATTNAYAIFSRLGNPAAHPDDEFDSPNDSYPAADGDLSSTGTVLMNMMIGSAIALEVSTPLDLAKGS